MGILLYLSKTWLTRSTGSGFDQLRQNAVIPAQLARPQSGARQKMVYTCFTSCAGLLDAKRTCTKADEALLLQPSEKVKKLKMRDIYIHSVNAIAEFM